MDIKWESITSNNDSCISNTFVNNNPIKPGEQAGCCNLFKYLELTNATEKNKWVVWVKEQVDVEDNWTPDLTNYYNTPNQ